MFGRFRAKVHEVGLPYTLELLGQALVPAWIARVSASRILELRTCDVSSVSASPRRRWLSRDGVERIAKLGHSPETLMGRFDGSCRVCALEEGGEVLAYAWFRAGEFEDEALRVRFGLGPGEIWLFDAMVARRHRGRRLYRALLQGAALDLAGERTERIYIAVDELNRNAMRAHLGASARPVSSVILFRFLGWTLLRWHGHWSLRRLAAGDSVELWPGSQPVSP